MLIQIAKNALVNLSNIELIFYDEERFETRFYLAGDCTDRKKNFASVPGNSLGKVVTALEAGTVYLDLSQQGLDPNQVPGEPAAVPPENV